MFHKLVCLKTTPLSYLFASTGSCEYLMEVLQAECWGPGWTWHTWKLADRESSFIHCFIWLATWEDSSIQEDNSQLNYVYFGLTYQWTVMPTVCIYIMTVCSVYILQNVGFFPKKSTFTFYNMEFWCTVGGYCVNSGWQFLYDFQLNNYYKFQLYMCI